jgi:acyl-CoA reductase-like NAD-dependent aldehyde dehydrogenase
MSALPAAEGKRRPLLTSASSRIDTYQNLIGNKWLSSSDGSTFADEDPSRRGSTLALFPSSTAQDIVKAIDVADAAFKSWKRSALEDRQRHAARFLDLLERDAESLASIVARENGKTLREARAEVHSALVEGRHHVAQVSRFYGQSLPAGTQGCTGWEQFHPLGVVAIISPWNFPMNVMCRKALPALLTGNTIVFKPATFTPWSGVTMAKLFESAGFPEGVFNCVAGLGSSIGNALVDDPRVKAISFTGSTHVGKKIHERAAKNLTRTQLELGGKNALIIMPDADLKAAVDAAIVAGFACAGQWCTSTSRVLVHRDVHREVSDRLAARCDEMRVGDPEDEKTDMGPVAGTEQFTGISKAIETGLREGARMLTGGPGKGELERGYFIRPTVFDNVVPDHTIFREEIFGPVLAVTEFNNLDHALELANDSVYGLSSAIFTRDVDAAQRYIDRIEAGLAHINIHTGFKLPALPFGGWKDSGSGLPENSTTGLEFFIQRKAVYWKASS